MSLVDEQRRMTDLIAPNEGCGGDYQSYSFSQSDNEVVISVALPEGSTRRHVSVDITTERLHIGVVRADGSGSGGAGERVTVLDGELYRPVKASECTWHLEDRRTLVVTLVKTNLAFQEWWPHVVRGEPQIDMRQFVPPPANLADLDEGAQAIAQKMMHEQRMKHLHNSV